MLDRFFSLFSHDLAIDLGTSNTLVWVRDKGITVREPSVLARQKKTKKTIAIGEEAKLMIGKAPPNIEVVRPLRGGVIADFDATLAMISYYIQKAHELGRVLPASFSRPRVAVGIPSAVTEVERRAVWEAALSAGARSAYLIEEPIAGAVGEGISIFSPNASMIVDVGGGTTEIAVISLGGIVIGRSLKIAGDNMDRSIAHYVRLRHGLLLGERTSENLKIKIGSAYEAKSKVKSQKSKVSGIEEGLDNAGEAPRDKKNNSNKEKMAVIRGRDIETGLPKTLRITEVEIREALGPVVSQIIDEIADLLEETPPELTSDILEKGILLTGGGSLLPGFDQLIVERTKIPVVLAQDPQTSVVRGLAEVLSNEKLLDRVKVVGGLK